MAASKQADKRDNFLSSELTKAELKMNITKFKSKIKKMEEAIAKEKLEVSSLQFAFDEAKCSLEEFVTQIERRPQDAQINIEKARKSIPVNKDVIDGLNNKNTVFKRDFARVEKRLNRHKWCESMLFKQSPLEWQEAQKAKTLTAKSSQNELSLKTRPDGQLSSECIQSSSNNDTLVTNSVNDSAADEESVEIYFSDPSQVVALLPELTDQILSLNYNSTEMDKTLEQTTDLTVCEMKNNEEKLEQEVNRMKDRVDKETKRATMFQKNVLLHDPSKTQNKDKMLVTLGKKVTEVHSNCVERPLNDRSTLDKLRGIEHHLSMLFQETENIPKDIRDKLWQLKDKEKKNRLREENLRLVGEKNIEKTKKCMNRAMGERMRYTGKKLMPRSFIVKKKNKVITDLEKPEEEDPLADLFTEDSD